MPIQRFIEKHSLSPDGKCKLENLQKTAIPGTQGERSFEAFYDTLAALAQNTGATERIGLCFSYVNNTGLLHERKRPMFFY